ncbi:RNA cap guanine-N2 methyltransferase [Aureococcus anophagefferens]|nr:RNA cap guanine-N2 methyltransferase [Aureococcus anophagefferens]
MGDVQHDEPHKKHHHRHHASQPRPFAIVDIRSDDEPAHDASCEDTLSEYCVGARANPLQADAGTPAPARGGRPRSRSRSAEAPPPPPPAPAPLRIDGYLDRSLAGGASPTTNRKERQAAEDAGAQRAGRARDALRFARAGRGPGRALAPRGRHARARGVYGVASNGGFTHGYGDDLLAPRVAAVVSRRGFGEAPFTWRAAAMVRLEERLQFMDGHRDDFERFGYEAWGRREFDYWLRDERNGAFRAQFEAAAPGARAALYGFCLEPFERMEALKTWDWRHTKASTYLYLACLGSGVASVLGTLLLQWGIPVVVFLFEIRHGRGSGFPALRAGRAATVQDRGEGARFTSAMILLVVFFYAAKVAPDAYAKFLGEEGGGGAVAKLVALRALLFRSENDSALQKVGFRLYRTMNSGFDVVLYTLNLYLLFYHHSPLEVILNSLAIEFIRDLDETLNVNANNRYLKASAVEMVMRSYLPLRDLRRRLGVRGYTASGIFERYVIYQGDQWDAHLFPADVAAGARGSAACPTTAEGENFRLPPPSSGTRATAARINRRPRLGDLLKTASLQRVYQAARAARRRRRHRGPAAAGS